MWLLVFNTEGKIFGKVSMHLETQSAGPQNKSARSYTIHHTSSVRYTEQERHLKNAYNSFSLTKHNLTKQVNFIHLSCEASSRWKLFRPLQRLSRCTFFTQIIICYFPKNVQVHLLEFLFKPSPRFCIPTNPVKSQILKWSLCVERLKICFSFSDACKMPIACSRAQPIKCE